MNHTLPATGHWLSYRTVEATKGAKLLTKAEAEATTGGDGHRGWWHRGGGWMVGWKTVGGTFFSVKCMVYVPPTVWVYCQKYMVYCQMYGLYMFFLGGFVFVGESWKESNGDLGSVLVLCCVFLLGDGTIILWFNHNWTEGVVWLNAVLFKQHWLLFLCISLSIQTLP